MKHKIQIPCTVQVADKSEPAEAHTIDLEIEAETLEEATRIAHRAVRQAAVDDIAVDDIQVEAHRRVIRQAARQIAVDDIHARAERAQKAEV